MPRNSTEAYWSRACIAAARLRVESCAAGTNDARLLAAQIRNELAIIWCEIGDDSAHSIPEDRYVEENSRIDRRDGALRRLEHLAHELGGKQASDATNCEHCKNVCRGLGA